jgi:tetratricopeptide (TPR) repeat protein
LLVLAVMVALPVAYFLTFRAEPSPSPPTAAARTLPSRTAALEARVADDAQDVAAWQELVVAYTQQATATGDPSYYGLAERAVARLDELAPDQPNTLLARGQLELSLHEFSAARRTAEDAVAALPASATALGILVDAQVELGEYDAAADTLQRMLDVDPGLPALARTSYLRELHGDRPGAITAMQRAEVAGAGFPPLGRARIIAARDEAAAALPDVVALTDRMPRLDAVLVLAELAEAADDPQAAEDALELARTLTSLQRDAGQVVDLELARLEADLGDPTVAVELARTAYDARPGNVHAADTLAWSLHRDGRSKEARPFLAEALRLGSVDPRMRLHAAAILAATGEPDRAAAHLRAVAASDPWVSFALLDDAGALAEDLGVAAPDAWTRR